MKNRFILSPFFLDEHLPQLKELMKPDWIINEPMLSGHDKKSRMSHIHRNLSQMVADTVHQGVRPVSIAGDCCTAIAVLAGLQRARIDPVLVWFDAHGDFNTPETTPSGFLGGMPLAMIVGKGDQSIMKASDCTVFPEERVVVTDARDLDPGERRLLENSRLIHLTDIKMLQEHTLPDGPLYIHLDTDIVTADEVPAQNYPVSGGPRASDVQTIFRKLADSHHIAAASLSSWNPAMDNNKQSQKICMELLNILVSTPSGNTK